MKSTNPRLTVKPLAGLLLAGVLASNLAHAQPTDPDRSRQNAVERLERAMSNLDLSAAQKAQLRSLTENHRQATSGLREQIRTAQKTIAETPQSDPNRAAIIAEARRSLETARSQLRMQQEQLQTNARAMLTSEQLNTLETRRAERAQRLAERRAAGQSVDRPRRFERRPGG